MRLKQIKLAGFKSFVDPTKIPFLNPLTAVIGPNGCGKSNIIDAVRWVLGESSAKHLRGDSMADVIFNGSTARRPVSVASVELLFENQDGRLSGEYASYQEIAVKRQVTRDGDSSYFLNGQKCRRKDITDLFMGTGLGPRSYAIIEQGTISRLIESKPQELRVFIEEAAGISRYKERRRETENRIRHTRENLERLADIRTELSRQLDKLAEQASAAKQYRELKQSERKLDAELSVSRFSELTLQMEKLTNEINLLEVDLAEFLALKESTELSLTQLKIQLVELDGQEQKRVEDFYLSGTQIAKLEQDLKHRQQQDAHIDKRIEDIVAKVATQLEQLKADEALAAKLSSDLADKTPTFDSLSDQVEAFKLQLTKKESQGETQSQALSHQKELVSTYRLEQEMSRGKLTNQQSKLEHKLQQQIKVKQQLEELATQANDSEQRQSEELEQLSEESSIQQELIDELDEQFGIANQTQIKLKAKQEALNQSLAEERGRFSLVSKLLPDETDTQEQALWQVLDVQPGWEKAVELLFDGLLKVPASQESCEAGFALFEQQNWHGVTANANLSPWLANVHWVESLSLAKKQLELLAEDQRIVTADGYLLGRGFCIKKGTDSSSLVQLKREQEALEASIAESEILLKEVNQSSHQQTALLESLTQELKLGHVRSQQLKLSMAGLSSQLAASKVRAAEQKVTLAKLEAESQQLQLDIEQTQGEERLLVDTLSQGEALYKEASAALAVLDGEHQAHLTQVRTLRSQIDELKQQQSVVGGSIQSLKTKIALKEQSLFQQKERIDELKLAKLALEHQLVEQDSQGDGQLSALTKQLNEALAQQQVKQDELAQLRQQQAQVQEASDSAGLKKKQQLGKIERLTQSISTLKLRREGIKGQADSQSMQLKEQQIEVELVQSAMDMNITLAARQRELERIRARIVHLGAINLAAIEEFEQQSERKSYLDSQDADLTKALTSLEEAIRKIDKETKTRFKDTFDKVNKDLGLLFPKVFGGGSAHLALTHDDLLETGVTIMARPPGKKNSTIHLLSGGEKALTALSLVFAIFRLNPAPFCMLDEVDAPLDDANVERFCRLVKEMSQSVQFIYISHNKITMELADQLIGVTMHEPGVSRIVAVDIEEAVAMADAV
ncbi:chromosome segregation protein SMC [Shewanella woodyi]|uniref:chromosome segregation protein SMC n=1 Tax=Shewanella woodyi TaxID=60961 RepID=UPI0007F8B97B|nr:chromosome segregation protein SMC [Shewanella woodyi]